MSQIPFPYSAEEDDERKRLKSKNDFHLIHYVCSAAFKELFLAQNAIIRMLFVFCKCHNLMKTFILKCWRRKNARFNFKLKPVIKTKWSTIQTNDKTDKALFLFHFIQRIPSEMNVDSENGWMCCVYWCVEFMYQNAWQLIDIFHFTRSLLSIELDLTW